MNEGTSESRWQRSRRVLKGFAPSASSFVPDHIACALTKPLSVTEWRPIPHFGESDEIVWRAIRPHIIAANSAEVILIVDACYAPGVGPFVLSLGDIADLAERFTSQFSDVVFGGDAVLLLPRAAIIVLVHHEGQFAVAKGLTE